MFLFKFSEVAGKEFARDRDAILASQRKDSEDSDEPITDSPGSSTSSNGSRTSTGEHYSERKRRLSTNSEDEHGMNGDLNGNDLVKISQRSPKENDANRPGRKRVKLEENGSKHKTEVRKESGKSEKRVKDSWVDGWTCERREGWTCQRRDGCVKGWLVD